MSESKRRIFLRYWFLFSLSVLCCFLFWKYSVQKLEIAFALGQTKVFDEITTSAEGTADPFKLSGSLEYVVWYYPSGVRQEKDSPLDKLVEIERSRVVKIIIGRLRTATGKNLGDDPEKWFAEYPPPR